MNANTTGSTKPLVRFGKLPRVPAEPRKTPELQRWPGSSALPRHIDARHGARTRIRRCNRGLQRNRELRDSSARSERRSSFRA